MSLKALTSPNKDESGMHTPLKHDDSNFDGQNVINSLRKRVTSTALRPKALEHFTRRLDESNLSSISPDSPLASRQLAMEDPETNSSPTHGQRASSLWLEDMICGAESLAAKLQQENKQMEALQILPNDYSSLGILTESAMVNSFEKSGALSESYKALIRNKESNNADRQVSSDNKETDDVAAEKSNDSTLVGGEPSYASVNFSNIDCADNPFSSPQLELGFDSKDFMSADSSAINKQLDKDQEEAKEPIPALYRMDLKDHSGVMEGEIEMRPPWLSPEKRLSGNRLSIGQYFASKSNNIKDIIHGIYPDRDRLVSPPKAKNSPLPTGLRPEFISSAGLSETIDLSCDEGDGTITLDNTAAENSVQCLDFDVTMVPGQDTILSISTIKDLVESDKGVNTITEHLFNTVQTYKSKPSAVANTSRETFVISSPELNSATSKPTTKSKIPMPVKASQPKTSSTFNTASLSLPSTSVTPSRVRKPSPSKPKRKSPGRQINYKSPKQMSTPVKNLLKRSPLAVLSPRFELNKPMIKLPLQIEGAIDMQSTFQGVTNLEIHVCVPVTNISSCGITCTLLDVGNSKYLEVKPENAVLVQPGSTEKLKLQVTALISGAHFLTLEVQIKSPGKEDCSHVVDPLKLNIEPPKVSIIKSDKGDQSTIDFGLCPEDSRKFIFFTLKNLGICTLPLHVSIDQGSEGPCFFFLVPSNEEEIEMTGAISVHLPGAGQTLETITQEICIAFVAPNLDNMRANKSGTSSVIDLGGKIIVQLDISGESPILAESVICGQVGHTQMLVSETDLTLCAGSPSLLRLRNGGIVPLELNLHTTHVESPQEELSVLIEPSKFLLNSGQEQSVYLTWTPGPGWDSVTVNRDLHLKYEGLISDNIVSLKCCPKSTDLSVSKVPPIEPPLPPLPIRATRTQLAWGSLSPGLTAQQFVSFRNTSNKLMFLQITIEGVERDQEHPFKVLSEAKEVTKQLELRLRPGQDHKIAVMFCPQKPGPAKALMNLSSSQPGQAYALKSVLLTGYGGQCLVILRRVAHSKGKSWLNLNPGLGDHVDGTFHLINTGTSPAYIHISSNIPGGSSCSVVVKPDTLMLLPQGNETVSVRLSRVSGILSKTHSGEIKTLASLIVTWINEVTRKRLRRLLPRLSVSEKSLLMRMEQATTLYELVETCVEGEENVVPDSEIAGLKDYSVTSAMSLSKDLASIQVELRAEGTGTNHARANETDTLSPFVSLMDATMLNMSQVSVTENANQHVEWTISPREVNLHAVNSYCTTLQVCNMSASQHLCLEIIARDELLVTPSVTEVLPCETITFELRLKRPPLHTAQWPAAVRIYSKNNVAEICVRVYAKNTGRVSRTTALANLTQSSSGSSSSVQEWLTPGGRMANVPAKPLPELLGPRSLAQLRETLLSSTSSSSQASFDTASSTTSRSVYLDTTSVIFPWTHVNSNSIVTLTIYNNIQSDKNVTVLSLRPPFSVEPNQFVVPGGWQKSIHIKFSPHVPGICNENLTLEVEGQSEVLSVGLQGHAISK